MTLAQCSPAVPGPFRSFLAAAPTGATLPGVTIAGGSSLRFSLGTD